ncbi:MAG: PBP1A family penicillin-binding protein [Proteobacteria bacterium]|nr:PBP1A family penicillin-binding protein [Pseudomonadota bacterium]
MTEPPGHEEEAPAEPGTRTFRADLLHQRAAGLNRFRRALIATGVAVAMLLTVGVAHMWNYFLSDVPQVPASAELASLGRAPGMTFVDRYGRTLATRGPKYGQAVRLTELPAYVPLAFLAAEDRRFRQHGALDLWGVTRALAANLKAGRSAEGASTLTQQLARDLFLGPEKTLKRKVQEAVLADKLFKQLGRDGVLELYLNRVYLGENAYGIDAAAKTYFGKPASALTLNEAAVLAGLPKAPSRLSLARDPEGALKRGRLVLDRMRREGWIKDADAARAMSERLALVQRQPEGDLAWVLDMAAAQARAEAGKGEGGLIIRLTIDPALQTTAAGVVRDALDKQGKAVGAGEAAVVLLGPDGAVRALVGGRDHDLSPFNRAVQARRQPGSAFKPFVWAAALEAGDKASDFRSTEPVAFGPWIPRDHAADGRAQLTLAEALAKSSNRVAVRLAHEAGPEKVVSLARRFGIAGLPDKPGLSVALGAYEVNLLDLTGAYQIFQQEGRFSRPWLVEEVARTDGTVLYRRPPQPQAAAFDRGKSDVMIRMMSGVIEQGTGLKARLDRPAAGKTGTAQDNRDAWFVGFTPDWTAGVWVGNDDHTPMRGVAGGDLPAEIWRRVMTAAHQGLPPRAFGPAVPEEPGAPTVVFEERSAFYSTLAAEFARVEGQGR